MHARGKVHEITSNIILVIKIIMIRYQSTISIILITKSLYMYSLHMQSIHNYLEGIDHDSPSPINKEIFLENQ